jgi:hypothetical protein
MCFPLKHRPGGHPTKPRHLSRGFRASASCCRGSAAITFVRPNLRQCRLLVHGVAPHMFDQAACPTCWAGKPGVRFLSRTRQFGRTSAPTMPHFVQTMRGPNQRTLRSLGNLSTFRIT